MVRTRLLLASDEIGLGEILIYQAAVERGHEIDILYSTNSFNNLVLNDYLLDGASKPVCVINRTERKHLRTFTAELLESKGLEVLHSYTIEYVANSKIKSKQAFMDAGIPFPRFSLIPKFPVEKYEGGRLARHDDVDEIAEILNTELGFPVILKPSEGSRGRSIIKLNSKEEFRTECTKYRTAEEILKLPYALYQTLSNPLGTFAEEFIPHALDLRVLVSAHDGKIEYEGCLARIGRSESEIAKNTALGSIPVGVENLPEEIKSLSIRALKSQLSYAAKIFAKTPNKLLIGVDIIPAAYEMEDRKKIYNLVNEITAFKDKEIEEAKREFGIKLRIRRKKLKTIQKICEDQECRRSIRKLDSVFQKFRELPGYHKMQASLPEHCAKSKLLVTETNPRVDFEFNTRNLAIPDFHYLLTDIAAG